jgi:hypothetical protein
MNFILLAYIRIFLYLLVIMMGLLMVYKKRHLLCLSNVLMAVLLMHNAIQYLYGTPNAYAFQITTTIVVGVWALAHVFELFRRV